MKRPLTQQELQELTAQGYDMSRYHGEDIEIPDAPQQTSALDAGTRSALASVIPTAAGGAGFAGGMAATGSLIAGLPIPPPYGIATKLLGGVLAGYGASKLAGAAQEAVLPESVKQLLATGEQEHPVASRIGSLATLPLGGFRLDPSGLARAASGLPKLATLGPKYLSIGERQALINATASGALGGIQEAVVAPMEGREITPGNVALGAAIGATHTAPTRFAQRYYKFHPSVGDVGSAEFTKAATLTPAQIAASQAARKPIVDLPEYALGPEQLFGKPKEVPKETLEQRWDKVLQKVYLGQDSGLGEYVTGVERLKGQHKKVIDARLKEAGVYDQWVADQPDYIGTKQDREISYYQDRLNNPELLDKAKRFNYANNPEGELAVPVGGTRKSGTFGSAGLTKEEASSIASQLKDGFPNVKITSKNIRGKDWYGIQWGEELPLTHPQDPKSEIEIGTKLGYKKEVLPRLPEEPILTPEGTKIQQALPENIAWTPAYQELINPILRRHGFQVELNGEVKDLQGNPVKGQAIPSKTIRTIINPLKAYLDTPIHEGFHGLQFLAEGGNKEAATLLTKLNKASAEGLAKYNELRVAAGKEPMTMEEFTATQQGFEFVKQAFNLEKETKWQKWWNDTKALFKSKYSGNASVDDLRRAINYRMINDTSISEGSVGVGIPQNQDEFEKASKAIGWKSKVTDPTPGSMQGSHTDTDLINAVLSGRKPVATGYKPFKNLPAGLEQRKTTNQHIIDWVGDYAIIKKGNTKALDMLGRAIHSGDSDAVGEALGYTKQEINEFNQRAELLSKHPDYRYQPVSEGLTDKNQLEVDIDSRKWMEKRLAKHQQELNDPSTPTSEKPYLRDRINYFRKQLDSTLTRIPESLNQPEGEGLRQPEHYAPGIGKFRPTEASNDTVRRKVDQQLGDAFDNFRARKEQFAAIGNTALQDLKNFPPHLVDSVYTKMDEAYKAGKTEPEEVTWSTPEEQQIFQILSPGFYGKYRDIQNALGLKINGRIAGSNPFYAANQLNDQMLDLFTRRSTSPEAMAAKREWAKYVEDRSGGEISFDEALHNISKSTDALGGERNNYLALDFGAIRKAAGYGLPDSMREMNAMKAVEKYNRRAAANLALYAELESKPEIANKLRLVDPNTQMYYPGHEQYEHSGYSGNTYVRDAMKWVTGNWSGTIAQEMPRINAAARAINAGVLGTPTGVRNITQIPVNMVPYIDRWSDFGAVWRGLMKVRENSRAALEYGATVPHIDKIMMNDLVNSPDRWTTFFQKTATFLRKWQGAEAIENFSRDLTFSIGRELAVSRLAAGDSAAAKWLDKFGLLVDKENPDVNQIAKNFVDRNQGTYSGAGLPAWVMESQFAPFLALQKWGIEKSNVIYQDVFKPFMTGENRLPLLTYTLGTFLTGAAIQKINELITGKKGQDPTWQEALDSGNAKQIVAEIATLMQLSAYAGIVSDGLKLAIDTTLTGRTPRNIVSFPLATSLMNTEERTRQMATALRDGENPWEVLKEYTLDLAQNQVQALRVVLNHTLREENVERSDKFRDLRVWNEMQGKPVGEISPGNPYLNLEARQYKRATTPQEAVTMLPGLVSNAIRKSGGNVEKMRKAFVSLAGNSYQTMSNIEQSPMTFQRYYNFLRRTQGAEQADERMQDFVRQSMINQMKSSLVPRF